MQRRYDDILDLLTDIRKFNLEEGSTFVCPSSKSDLFFITADTEGPATVWSISRKNFSQSFQGLDPEFADQLRQASFSSWGRIRFIQDIREDKILLPGCVTVQDLLEADD